MKISIGELRQLIREAASFPSTKSQQIVQHVVYVAEEYVNSVVAGSPDKRSAEELRNSAEQISSLAKWLLNKREKNSEPIAVVAKYARDLAELSDFWKRPSFLGKSEYVEKLKSILLKMQRKQIETLS